MPGAGRSSKTALSAQQTARGDCFVVMTRSQLAPSILQWISWYFSGHSSIPNSELVKTSFASYWLLETNHLFRNGSKFILQLPLVGCTNEDFRVDNFSVTVGKSEQKYQNHHLSFPAAGDAAKERSRCSLENTGKC